MFRFANPLALMLLILPVGWWVLYRLTPWLRSGTAAVSFSDIRFLMGLPRGWRVRLYHLPDVLRMLAWVALVVVVARPQSGQQREIVRGQGIDIVIALDISVSMAAQDIAPSRLEGAKAQIERFVQGRNYDRVGLVVFASDAYHYVPPTLDYDLYVERLRDVRLVNEYGLDASGTAIGTGIASAVSMLRDSDAESRIVVLLTDGSNTTGSVSPVDAARAAAALGVRVYTIGVGQLLAPTIPESPSSENFDEGTLQTIADISDALYFQVADNAGLRLTYDQIDALERSSIEQQVFVNWRDRSLWLMWVALILLVVERVLRQTVFQAVP